MKIIAIRHGETEWNALGREQGQLDSSLTTRGLKQAEAIAERLRRVKFSALYSSDLGRARNTAEIVAKATGDKIETDAGLRERHTGIFQGLTNAQMAAQYPREYSAYQSDPYAYQVPGGESGQQRTERSVRVMNALADRHASETIVIITHGGFLIGFFEHVLGLAPGNAWRFKRQNAAFNAFDRVDGKWSLETWNDTSHLDALGSLDEPPSL